MVALSNIKYRPDIDGLRAIAVLSVIFFHFNRSWLPGGFVGVDIFFVISGFLITSILYKELKNSEFSFPKFYLRRIKRILPVFFVVVFAVILFGYFVMTPKAYYALGNSAASTLGFLSNMYFAGRGGYFDSSDQFPLLHTWSLSVEEQYYLVWPVLLLLLFKLNLNLQKTKLITLLLIVIFFALSQILCANYHWASWAYFILPSRAGELLIGSYIAFTTPNNTNSKFSLWSSLLGILLIVASLIFLNKTSQFPGINSFWPTLGAALIIYGNPQSIVNKCLATPLLVYIGLLSYSLYLWHWPILAYMRYIVPSPTGDLSVMLIVIAAGLTFLLSIASYYLIEQPTRKMNLKFLQAFKFYFIAPAALVILFAFFNYTSKGNLGRYSNEFLEKFKLQSGIIDETTCHNTAKRYCVLGQNDNLKIKPILVYGDSHAGELEYFFRKLSAESSHKLVFHGLTSDSCTVATDLNVVSSRYRHICELNRTSFKEVSEQYKTIIIAGRWEKVLLPPSQNGATPDYPKKLDAFIRNLSLAGKRVIIIAQVPNYNIDVNKNEFVTRRLGFNLNYKMNDDYRQANSIVEKIAKNYKNVYFINLNQNLCPAGVCSPYDSKNQILYKDDNHLNMYGSEVLANHFMNTPDYSKFLKIISP